MHIKQITISNFRSFRQQPEITPFSSGTNAVVGRNGSGKSNLFDAVQFVLLTPKFVSLRQEERQSLLHEGAGSTAVNAFCEVVFDNSDKRLAVDGDEVVLRRTVGLKKDEFFIQRKRATKKEIASLLEGAGFSKGNPYYIVQQGKVNALCTMSSVERLDLLKEVAGCTVYDEKRADSLKQMEENAHSREKISEVLDYIDNRLSELQDEKEELTEYQKLDRRRRAMEYALYDKELRKAREQLDEIEHVRSDDVENLSHLHEEARRTHDAIRTVEMRMKQVHNRLRRNRTLLKGGHNAGLEADNTAAMTRRTQLELEIKELEEALSADKSAMERHKKELKKLQSRIGQAQKELGETAMPKYEHAREVMNRLTREKMEATKKAEGLYAKQGRGRQFRTEEERDEYLRGQIGELDAALSDKRHDISGGEEALAALRRKVQNEEQAVQKTQADMTKKTHLLDKLTTTLDEKRRERDEIAKERKTRWKELEDMGDKTTEARESARRCESDLRKVMPRATAMGLDALRKIVAEDSSITSRNYMGPLMENFELVEPKFQTAVEVAAQNALFHVIVDTDATAAKLVKILEQRKLGRVTFLPLNQLNVDNASYPQSNDVVPMLSRCVRYDARVEKAMKHVFGRKLLAKTVDAASQFSSTHSMDAITLDGDLCSRKGALSGGYIDETKSKLKAYHDLNSARTAWHDLENQQRDFSKKATAADQRVSSLMGEMQKTEAKHANLNHVLEQTAKEVESQITRNESRKKQCAEQAEALPKLREECDSLEATKANLQEEIGTPLTEQLSETEREMLTNLLKVQKELEAEIDTQTTVLEEASVEKQRLQSLLDDNLLKRKAELEDSIASVSLNADEAESGVTSPRRASRGSMGMTTAANRRRQLELRLEELDEAEGIAEEAGRKLSEAQEEDAKCRAELDRAKAELEELKAKDLASKQALEEASENAERMLNKRSMCVSKREMYMRKIQELGSLPPASELSEHSKVGIQALMRSLEKCNKELKKYSHVNKKAYDQYVNFSEQREQLLTRKEELDQGAEKVKELIESLDRQKDEAINRTFRGVSAHFKDVFTELVPNGAGELILRTAIDESKGTSEDGDSSDDDEEGSGEDGSGKKASNPSVSLYRGVDVKVRFSAVGENFLMSQLSGGQKALVAMALIFAIQRCDPAPFYLFDELDQALDSTYRAAVAALIQRQANSEENPTQFICSTFRPELVSVANRCYGISHQNKESRLHNLSKKDALHFISNLMSEEETLGEVTSLAPSRSRVTAVGSSKTGNEKQGDESDGDSEDANDEEEEHSQSSEEKTPPAASRKRTRQPTE